MLVSSAFLAHSSLLFLTPSNSEGSSMRASGAVVASCVFFFPSSTFKRSSPTSQLRRSSSGDGIKRFWQIAESKDLEKPGSRSSLFLPQTPTACWTAWPCLNFPLHLASSINHSTSIQCDAHGHPPPLALTIPLHRKNVQLRGNRGQERALFYSKFWIKRIKGRTGWRHAEEGREGFTGKRKDLDCWE